MGLPKLAHETAMNDGRWTMNDGCKAANVAGNAYYGVTFAEGATPLRGVGASLISIIIIRSVVGNCHS